MKYGITFPIFFQFFTHCANAFVGCVVWNLKPNVFSSQQQYKASDIPRDRSIVVVTCFIRRVFYYRSIEQKCSSSLHDQFELPKHDSDSCLQDLLLMLAWAKNIAKGWVAKPLFLPLLCKFLLLILVRISPRWVFSQELALRKMKNVSIWILAFLKKGIPWSSTF